MALLFVEIAPQSPLGKPPRGLFSYLAKYCSHWAGRSVLRRSPQQVTPANFTLKATKIARNECNLRCFNLSRRKPLKRMLDALNQSRSTRYNWGLLVAPHLLDTIRFTIGLAPYEPEH